MPKSRFSGGTWMRRSAEKTILPSTEISPASGFSSPAIERSVVVLPQPLGPSSANIFPRGTSKDTSATARTDWPLSVT
jgi:hypothetical protein